MSSLHQGGISSCLACHSIHADWHRGEGSGSLGVDVSRGGRPSPSLALTRHCSLSPRSYSRWGFSGGGISRSSSPSARTVPASPLSFDQLACLDGASSVCHIGGGSQWVSSTFALCSGLFCLWGCPPFGKCHLGQPLLEVNLHPSSLVGLCLGIIQSGLSFSMVGFSWGSPWCPKDLDLLCQWLPEHQWLLDLQQLLEHCWLVDWIILSILSSRIAAAARAHWWASLMRAIISLYESCFVAVNFLYMLLFVAANSVWGSGQGVLASNCFCSPSTCADGQLSQRCSLMESRISLQRHSSVASSHQPLLGSLQSW